MNRRLYRCRENRRLAGVAAGVAEFFELDPTLVRVLWFLSIFVGGLGIFLYIGLALIVPLEPVSAVTAGAAQPAGSPAGPDETSVGGVEPEGHHHHAGTSRGTGRLSMFVGIALILFGSLALVSVLFPGWEHSGRYLWPLFFVGIGAVLIAGALRREPDGS
jgi:phage shock protein C